MNTDTTTARAAVLLNGTYTVKSGQTGGHRTFAVRTQPDDARFAPGRRIVALLTGPDNENDYTGFGWVTDTGIEVWLKKRAEAGQPRSLYEAYAEMLWELNKDAGASAWGQRGLSLLCEARCLVCNRKLTTPESIERGIGPECYARMTGE